MVARHLDVLDRQGLEQRRPLEAGGDSLHQGGVVVVALRDGELEDGGVRGHAHHPVLRHQAIELARGQGTAPDEVEPHALAQIE